MCSNLGQQDYDICRGVSGKETVLLIPLDIIMSGWDASPVIAKLGPQESSLIMKLMVRPQGRELERE